MADFLSNLLLRSSAPAFGTILQPRLPSLFESPDGADELPAPQAASVPLSAPGAVEQVAPQGAALSGKPRPLMERDAPVVEPQNTVSTVLSQNKLPHARPLVAREEPSGFVQNDKEPGASLDASDKLVVHSAQVDFSVGQPVIKAHSLEQQAAMKSSTIASPVRFEREAQQPGMQSSNLLAAPLEPGQARAQGGVFGEQPALDARSAPQPASRSAHAQQTTSPVAGSPQQVFASTHPGGFSQPKRERIAVLEPVQAEHVFRPLAETVHSKPVLKAIVTQPAQTQPSETVVQVHIGRIEVRAMTAPAAPQAAPVAHSQPKMSLDDYLRQREEKQ